MPAFLGFPAVAHARKLAWKKRPPKIGLIIIGTEDIPSSELDKDCAGWTVPAGKEVKVYQMDAWIVG